jgi:aminoglycoside phosphotransferase (APT) family kinase protein
VSGTWPPALADLGPELARVCAEALAGAVVTGVRPAPGGHSGFTYVLDLDRAPGALVVRVPPPGARPVGPADVLRQARVMAALGRAGIPVPAVMATGEGGGRPFAVMSFVAGEPVAAAAAAEAPGRLLAAALDVLAAIRSLEPEATGLAGEEPRAPAWQVERWERLMARGAPELTARAPELAERLLGSAPPPAVPALVHGDYHFGNLLFAGGRVAAVLDWEIAELGPPEVDVACLCVTALRRALPGVNPGGEVAVTVEDVLRTAGTGYRDPGWFVAAGCYKYAAILAYNLDLHVRGKRVDPVYEGLRETIAGLIDAGIRYL